MGENEKDDLGDLKKASRSWLLKSLLLSLVVGSVVTPLATLVFKEPTWKDNLLIVSSFVITSLAAFIVVMGFRLLKYEHFFFTTLEAVLTRPPAEEGEPRHSLKIGTDWRLIFLTRRLDLKDEAIEKLTKEHDRLAFAADHLIAALVQEVLLPLWRNRDERSGYDPTAQLIGVLVLKLAERIPDLILPSQKFIGLFEMEEGLVRNIFETATDLGVADPSSPLIKELRFWLNVTAAEERQPPPDDDHNSNNSPLV